MRVLLGHHGLRGDLAINLPAITYLRDAFGWQIDMPIHKRFSTMSPLFLNHPALANVVITDGYDDFPTLADQHLLSTRHYDRVYSPMQPHGIDRWFEHMHQTDAVLADYLGLRLPPEYRQIKLTKWFEVEKWGNMIAFAPFAGYESNPANEKRLSTECAQEIVDYLLNRSHDVLQLGGPGEPKLYGATSCPLSYYKAIIEMLGCKALITTDTGAAWYASGYQFPTLGLYGHRYYGAAHVKAIQPVNPNGLYLDAPTVAEIPMERITAAIDTLLP